MNRRNFLRGLIGLAAAPVMAEAARVYSFPSEIKIYQPAEVGEWADYLSHSDLELQTAISPEVSALGIYYNRKFIENLKANLVLDNIMRAANVPAIASIEDNRIVLIPYSPQEADIHDLAFGATA